MILYSVFNNLGTKRCLIIQMYNYYYYASTVRF